MPLTKPIAPPISPEPAHMAAYGNVASVVGERRPFKSWREPVTVPYAIAPQYRKIIPAPRPSRIPDPNRIRIAEPIPAAIPIPFAPFPQRMPTNHPTPMTIARAMSNRIDPKTRATTAMASRISNIDPNAEKTPRSLVRRKHPNIMMKKAQPMIAPNRILVMILRYDGNEGSNEPPLSLSMAGRKADEYS